MIIQNVDINGACRDVRLSGGVIAEIGNSLVGNRYHDGQGGALIPGLHDHHIHLNATAAAMNSVKCGPPDVNSDNDLIARINQPGQGWLRGVGYHQSVAGDIDRTWLDEYGPSRPVRIQHRSGRLWILNSLAIDILGQDMPKNGRLFDQDIYLRNGANFPNLTPLVKRLLSYGITGVTEVTPSNGLDEYHNYLKKAKPLKLSVMGKAELCNFTDRTIGPLKLHYHDHKLPSLDDLALEISMAHNKGRAVAAHCVTRAELMLTLAAIEQAGSYSGDRIEHAAIADKAAINWMKKLGMIVVTQPNFIRERAPAYEKDIAISEYQNLWRLRSFHIAGLKIAAGSDAPFGNPNPWFAMAAAVNRPNKFESENISPELALALYTKPVHDAGGTPRKIGFGETADLCLLDRPWNEARQNLTDVKVTATWIDGELVYNRVN